ncbi:MAG TPA: glycoside hydrolase domain-containing protein [Nocardioides sp.]|nr:glycoside hydrolase domain-containing protein [Nocardioides sp.]
MLMHLSCRVPSPPVLASFVLALLLSLTAIVGGSTTVAPPRTAATGAPAIPSATRARPVVTPAPPTPAPARGSQWSGYAFDACRAPSQRLMDRWRTSSPFSGVGIYLGGIHRACDQRNLTAGWVRRQMRSGWKLLPIWVGPQASCSGYDHRISGRPGRRGRYAEARARGASNARAAVRAARGVALPRGEVLFYDIEPFDTRVARCRRSSLAFLEEWTKEVHRRGYRSGVYSHVNAAISLISRTGRGYARPDAVWYAWIDRVGAMPHDAVVNASFMRTSRVHQYVLDKRVSFGGLKLDIDWNFVSLGSTRAPASTADCDQRAARVQPRPVEPGSRGGVVRVVQCLVLPGHRHPVKVSGRYDQATVRAVRRFQHRRGMQATGLVDRRTWTSLLARGTTPVLKKGAQGDSVRRLQRTINVALGNHQVRVDGAYGKATARAVRHYRKRLGLQAKPVVTARVWKALARGKVVGRRG